MTKVTSEMPKLLEAARAAKLRAHAPYSGFPVGAALLCADGTIIGGCNVENASYPAGACAERVALGSAVAAGHRQFSAVVIVTDAPEGTPPCGICRQALAEFGVALDVIAVTPDGRETRWTLEQLLPHPFTPSSLRLS
jgi:cytidine deaminase